MVTFACFHLPPPNETTRQTYWALYQMMAASARRACPGANVHLITSDAAGVPERIDCDGIFRYKAGHSVATSFERLKVEEVTGWRGYLASTLFSGPTVLVDADLLIQRDPTAMFDESFDVGLTFTSEPGLHAINTGVIFVDPTNLTRLLGFFDQILKAIEGVSPELQAWLGDQEAVDQVLGNPDVSDRGDGSFAAEAADVRLRLIPVDEWNYSEPLDGENRPVLRPAPDKGIVHFKGDRKALMLRYAHEVLGFQAIEDETAPGGWTFLT